MCRLLRIPEDQDAVTTLIATMPLVLRVGASERCPHQTSRLLGKLGGLSPHDPGETPHFLWRLEGGATTPALSAAREAALTLTGVMGSTPPSWTALSKGARPPDWTPEDFEPSAHGSGVALSVSPSSIFTRREPQLFRVLLLRRLRISLPFSRRFWWCCRSLDAFGHHRAACSRAGVLGRRGSHWRVPPPEPAGKQEGVSPPMCWSEIWTSRFQTHSMVGT